MPATQPQSHADIMQRLTEIFQEVFLDDQLAIERNTTAKDVQGWDSLMHVSLIINVEKAFGVRFRSSEVAGLKNVGELADILSLRLNAV